MGLEASTWARAHMRTQHASAHCTVRHFTLLCGMAWCGVVCCALCIGYRPNEKFAIRYTFASLTRVRDILKLKPKRIYKPRYPPGQRFQLPANWWIQKWLRRMRKKWMHKAKWTRGCAENGRWRTNTCNEISIISNRCTYRWTKERERWRIWGNANGIQLQLIQIWARRL